MKNHPFHIQHGNKFNPRTDEEAYQKIKKNKDKNKDKIMISAKDWKERRLRELKRQGKIWSE